MSITRDQLQNLKVFAEGETHTYDMKAIKAAVETLERLPETEDGVPVVPEMTIYDPNGVALLVLAVEDNSIIQVKRVGVADADWHTTTEGKYSTLQAAEAARGGEDG